MGPLLLIAVAFVFPLLAYLVLVLRLAHPLHRRLAIGLYVLGWIPFCASVWQHREALSARSVAVEGVLQGYGLHAAALAALVVIAYVGRILFPPERSALADLDDLRGASHPIHAVVVGKALLDGRFRLDEALRSA